MRQPPKTLYKGAGCNLCARTGYRGRTGIFEVFPITDEIRKILPGNVSAGDIRAQALKDGMVSMNHDGMLKVAEGITTVSEVLRSVFSTSLNVQPHLRGSHGVSL